MTSMSVCMHVCVVLSVCPIVVCSSANSDIPFHPFPFTPTHTKYSQDQMTLGQLNLGADIYHIRMDHQNPSHFLSLPHPHSLSNVALNEHDYINNKPSSSSTLSAYVMANHRSVTTPQEATMSDIRSMSVDPGSLDEQLSSQGSGDGGMGGGGGRKRAGEYSGGVFSNSELVVVGGGGGRVVAAGGSGSGSGGVVSPPLSSGNLNSHVS